MQDVFKQINEIRHEYNQINELLEKEQEEHECMYFLIYSLDINNTLESDKY